MCTVPALSNVLRESSRSALRRYKNLIVSGSRDGNLNCLDSVVCRIQDTNIRCNARYQQSDCDSMVRALRVDERSRINNILIIVQYTDKFHIIEKLIILSY